MGEAKEAPLNQNTNVGSRRSTSSCVAAASFGYAFSEDCCKERESSVRQVHSLAESDASNGRLSWRSSWRRCSRVPERVCVSRISSWKSNHAASDSLLEK